MILQTYQGKHSRTAKIKRDFWVIWIRAEYDAGRRGKANAARFGISPVRYNVIGSRKAWKHL